MLVTNILNLQQEIDPAICEAVVGQVDMAQVGELDPRRGALGLLQVERLSSNDMAATAAFHNLDS